MPHRGRCWPATICSYGICWISSNVIVSKICSIRSTGITAVARAINWSRLLANSSVSFLNALPVLRRSFPYFVALSIFASWILDRSKKKYALISLLSTFYPYQTTSYHIINETFTNLRLFVFTFEIFIQILFWIFEIESQFFRHLWKINRLNKKVSHHECIPITNYKKYNIKLHRDGYVWNQPTCCNDRI